MLTAQRTPLHDDFGLRLAHVALDFVGSSGRCRTCRSHRPSARVQSLDAIRADLEQDYNSGDYGPGLFSCNCTDWIGAAANCRGPDEKKILG